MRTINVTEHRATVRAVSYGRLYTVDGWTARYAHHVDAASGDYAMAYAIEAHDPFYHAPSEVK